MSSRPPTTTRSVLSGSAVNAGPSAAVIAASTIPAAPPPISAERQPRVIPTASTIVSASTASTAQATNTETASPSSWPLMTDLIVGNQRVAVARGLVIVAGSHNHSSAVKAYTVIA